MSLGGQFKIQLSLAHIGLILFRKFTANVDRFAQGNQLLRSMMSPVILSHS